MEFLPLAQSLALPWSSIRSWHSAPRLCLPQPEEVCDWIPKGMLENAIFNSKRCLLVDFAGQAGYLFQVLTRGLRTSPLQSRTSCLGLFH